METVETLKREISDKLLELSELADNLSKLQPVSHRSKSIIQWHGGIIGAIQSGREGRRLEKLINEPIVNNISFYQMANYIVENANYLVERQLKIQSLVNKNDEINYGIVIDIFNYINKITTAWYNYSPDMANEILDQSAALAPTVRHIVQKNIKKLDLPEQLKVYYKNLEKQETSGCLGVVAIILISSFVTIGAMGILFV